MVHHTHTTQQTHVYEMKQKIKLNQRRIKKTKSKNCFKALFIYLFWNGKRKHFCSHDFIPQQTKAAFKPHLKYSARLVHKFTWFFQENPPPNLH